VRVGFVAVVLLGFACDPPIEAPAPRQPAAPPPPSHNARVRAADQDLVNAANRVLDETATTSDAMARAAPTMAEDPAPSAGPRLAIATGLLACDAWAARWDRYLDCARLPSSARAQLAPRLHVLFEHLGDLISDAPASVRERASITCRTEDDALARAAARIGCSL
jgi:hypothetical protein